jgi:hypothetical protein
MSRSITFFHFGPLTSDYIDATISARDKKSIAQDFNEKAFQFARDYIALMEKLCKYDARLNNSIYIRDGMRMAKTIEAVSRRTLSKDSRLLSPLSDEEYVEYYDILRVNGCIWKSAFNFALIQDRFSIVLNYKQFNYHACDFERLSKLITDFTKHYFQYFGE